MPILLLVVLSSGCVGLMEDEIETEPPDAAYESLPGFLDFGPELEPMPESRPESSPESSLEPIERAPRVPTMYRCRLKVVVDERSPPTIRATIRRHENDVRVCYNRALRRDPSVKGRVTVEFVIEPEGTVPVAIWRDSEIDDVHMLNCITRTVRTWTFPVAPDSGSSIVRYPWVFSVPPATTRG